MVLATLSVGYEANIVRAAPLHAFCNQYGSYIDYIYYNVPNPFASSQVDQVTVTIVDPKVKTAKWRCLR